MDQTYFVSTCSVLSDLKNRRQSKQLLYGKVKYQFSLLLASFLMFITPVLADTTNPQTSETFSCDALSTNIDEAEQLYLTSQFKHAQEKLQAIIPTTKTCEDLYSEGWALKHLSATFYYQQQIEQSRKHAEMALAIAVSLDDNKLRANALNLIGLSWYTQENYEKAIQIYRQAEGSVDGFPSINFKLNSNLGEAYYWNLQYDQAIGIYHSIETLAEQLGKNYSQVNFKNLAEAYYWKGDYAKSIEYYKKALTQTEHPLLQGMLYSGLGNAYYNLGDYNKAVNELSLALPLLTENGDTIQQIRVHNSLAQANIALGDFDDAVTQSKRSIEVAEAANLPDLHATGLGILAQALTNKSDLEGAIEAYSKAYTIALQQDLPNLVFTSASGLHLTYLQQGQYLKARDIFLKELQTEDLNSVYKLDYLKLLGQLYIGLGDYNQAINYYQQQLDLAQHIGDLSLILDALELLGNTYYSGGFYKRSIQTYNRLLTIAKASKDKVKQTASLANLAWAYRSLSDFQTAKTNADKAVELAGKIDEPWVQWQALNAQLQLQILTASGDPVATAEKMLGLDRENDILYAGSSLISLADAYAHTGDTELAVENYLKALDISRRNQDVSEQANILNYLATLYLNERDYPLAQTTFRQAIALLESTQIHIADADSEAVSFANSQRAVYQGLIKSLIEQGKIGEALEVSELGRAKALTHLLNRRLDATGTDTVSGESIKLIEITELAKQTATTFIEFAITLDAIYVWVVSADGEIEFEKINAFIPSAVMTPAAVASRKDAAVFDISQLIADTRGAVVNNQGESNDSGNQVDLRLRQLYDFLIKPIEKYLPDSDTDRVVILPQGDLLQIPFAALIDNDGRYLIEKHTLQIASSVKLLQLANSLKNTKPNQSSSDTTVNALIVGNPVFNSSHSTVLSGLSVSPLPGAQIEAIEIAQILNANALIGEQASELEIRNQIGDAPIIHFATHGLLEYGNPDESGIRDMPGAIVLAADKESTTSQNDGLLTAAEIMDISMNADLAVLSACNTGNGRITADGVVGLSRAFIAAGVPNIVVSLWAIPDAPTSTLMIEFYRSLQKTDNKAAALRQAMLATMKRHPNPADWAAFILLGDIS